MPESMVCRRKCARSSGSVSPIPFPLDGMIVLTLLLRAGRDWTTPAIVSGETNLVCTSNSSITSPQWVCFPPLYILLPGIHRSYLNLCFIPPENPTLILKTQDPSILDFGRGLSFRNYHLGPEELPQVSLVRKPPASLLTSRSQFGNDSMQYLFPQCALLIVMDFSLHQLGNFCRTCVGG